MGFLDPIKNVFNFNFETEGEAPRRPNEEEVGVLVGTNDIQGFSNALHSVHTNLSADHLLRLAGGRKALKNIMYEDTEVLALMEKRKGALYGVKHRIVTDSEEDKEFVQENIAPFMLEIIESVFDAIPYGYSVAELIWKQEGNLFTIDGMRKTDYMDFVPLKDGKNVAYYAAFESGNYGDTAPFGKYLTTVRNATANNSLGDPLLARLWMPYTFRKSGMSNWTEWVERYAKGMIEATVDSTEPKEIKKVKDMIQKLRGGALSHTKAVEIEVHEASGVGLSFEKYNSAVIDSYARLILGETLTTRMENGSMAAASVHNEVRLEKVKPDMFLLEQALNRLVRILMDP